MTTEDMICAKAAPVAKQKELTAAVRAATSNLSCETAEADLIERSEHGRSRPGGDEAQSPLRYPHGSRTVATSHLRRLIRHLPDVRQTDRAQAAANHTMRRSM